MGALGKDRTAEFRIRSAEGETVIAVAEVLDKADLIFVPPEDFEVMMAALNEPVTVIPELVRLAGEPRMFVRTRSSYFSAGSSVAKTGLNDLFY